MTQAKVLKTLLLALFVMTVHPGRAAKLPAEDFQLWENLTVIGPLQGKLQYWLEGQLRYGDEVRRLSQSLFRTGIGYALKNSSSIWLGYAHFNTGYPFRRKTAGENRIWQQFLWADNYAWGRLSTRTRLEQRFIESVARTGWRFRQLAKIERSIDKNDKVFLALSEELFVHLNNTRTIGSNRGFRQNRVFAGLGVLAAENAVFEIGYQYQYIKRVTALNYNGNALVSSLFFNFS